MTEVVECVVVGAGVVGLAIARTLALKGHEVLLLDAENAFGKHSSSRNSEVIHAGIYYPANSLKALCCVLGRSLLYEYCKHRGVDHRRLGKLIVATNSQQLEVLRRYQTQACANGVEDLELISAEKLHQLEPEVNGLAALWSPSTGIIDSHALMLSLLGEIENANGTLVLNSQVCRFSQLSQGYSIEVDTSESRVEIRTRWLVNAAGHGALDLANASATNPAVKNYYAAGHYFSYSGPSPFRQLVYPVAGKDSLGIHATLDLGGQLKFGPDVDWRERLDYSFDMNERRLQSFVKSIRAYYPGLEDGRLQPGYVGVRSRINGPAEPPVDFVIAGPQHHGQTGLVQLFGIESPGLTASLAIAQRVASLLADG